MLDENTATRSGKLLEVFVAERTQQFATSLRKTDAELSARGLFHSSTRVLETHRAFAFELRSRGAYAWQSLHRAHIMQGRLCSDSTRDDLKLLFNARLQQLHEALEHDLKERLEKARIKIDLALTEEAALIRDKHDVEIDLYVDSLMKNETGTTSAQYHFYGAIGAVQTAAGSVANIVQNLDGSDREEILAALTSLRELVSQSSEIASDEKAELGQIAADCSAEIVAGQPNGLKLRSLLTTIGTTVQTVASVQPAYTALKVAALAIGVALP